MCCAEVCLMEVDGGHCDGNVLAWHFDRHTEQCRNFTYSGCGGNNNRFVTEEECVSQCLWITAEGNHTISTAPVHLWGMAPGQCVWAPPLRVPAVWQLADRCSERNSPPFRRSSMFHFLISVGLRTCLQAIASQGPRVGNRRA